MKNYLSIFTISLILLANLGCKKDVKHTTFPVPDWKEDQTGKYPVSMTAVVTTYYPLNADFLPGDKFAAFVNDECRGVGTLVNISSVSSAFFVMIHGTASEQSKIKFKYYSSKSSYIYSTTDILNFTIDSNFGTADKPEIIDLKETD